MIEVILRTRPGEQLMRPEFGAGLEELLHEPNDVGTRRRIRDLVMGALVRWEPRIDIQSVDVDEVDGRPSEVRVEIAYRVQRTGAVDRVGAVLEVGG
jgi:phage baseplate assembly protein W